MCSKSFFNPIKVRNTISWLFSERQKFPSFSPFVPLLHFWIILVHYLSPFSCWLFLCVSFYVCASFWSISSSSTSEYYSQNILFLHLLYHVKRIPSLSTWIFFQQKLSCLFLVTNRMWMKRGCNLLPILLKFLFFLRSKSCSTGILCLLAEEKQQRCWKIMFSPSLCFL